MYSWDDVAERTEKVYYTVLQQRTLSLAERLERYHGCGVVAGKLGVLIMAVNYMLMLILEFIWPKTQIEIAQKFDVGLFQKFCSEKRAKLL